MVRYKCSACKDVLTAADGLGGKAQVCPNCGAQNRVPTTVADFIAQLEPDIATGRDTDIWGLSGDAAAALTRMGAQAVDALIEALGVSSSAHWALGRIGGEKAFRALCKELGSDNWRRGAAAAQGLGEIGDPRALERLREHSGSRIAEVNYAVREAMAKIERKQRGKKWLEVDKVNPYGQVERVFAQMRSIVEDEQQREAAIVWHRDFVRAMPELSFPDNEAIGHTWAMLGTLIFYALNPDTRSIDGICPEAAYCFEKCLDYTPDRDDIRAYLSRVKPRGAAAQDFHPEAKDRQTAPDARVRALDHLSPQGAALPPPISFRCPQCRRILKVRVTAAGKKVKCPACGQILRIPAKPAAPRVTKQGTSVTGAPAKALKPLVTPSTSRLERVSKAFYLGSYWGGHAVAMLLGIPLLFLIDRIPVELGLVIGLVGLGLVCYGQVAALALIYKMWSAIQGWPVRTTPGAAVGRLFIPFYNLYWLFQATWGWARDYNRCVVEAGIAAPKMPEKIALAACIVLLAGILIPGAFAIGTVPVLVLLGLFFWKACEGINALAAVPQPAAHGRAALTASAATKATPGSRRLAIASLVLGLAGFVTGGLAAIGGLVLGLLSLSRTNRKESKARGRGAAWAGTWVSAFCILLMAMLSIGAVARLVPGIGEGSGFRPGKPVEVHLDSEAVMRVGGNETVPEALEDLLREYGHSVSGDLPRPAVVVSFADPAAVEWRHLEPIIMACAGADIQHLQLRNVPVALPTAASLERPKEPSVRFPGTTVTHSADVRALLPSLSHFEGETVLIRCGQRARSDLLLKVLGMLNRHKVSCCFAYDSPGLAENEIHIGSLFVPSPTESAPPDREPHLEWLEAGTVEKEPEIIGLGTGREKPPAQGTAERRAPALFGVPPGAGAHKIVYVMDRSGSMTDSMDILKMELKRSIAALGEDMEFHVIFFSSGAPVEMPTRRLVQATDAARLSAAQFIGGVMPHGQTDPSEALRRAFALRPDAIYLLTDGEFGPEVLELVKSLYADHKTRVHTIAFLYDTGQPLLKVIADHTGGTHKFFSEKDLAERLP